MLIRAADTCNIQPCILLLGRLSETSLAGDFNSFDSYTIFQAQHANGELALTSFQFID